MLVILPCRTACQHRIQPDACSQRAASSASFGANFRRCCDRPPEAVPRVFSQMLLPVILFEKQLPYRLAVSCTLITKRSSKLRRAAELRRGVARGERPAGIALLAIMLSARPALFALAEEAEQLKKHDRIRCTETEIDVADFRGRSDCTATNNRRSRFPSATPGWTRQNPRRRRTRIH